MRRKLHLQGTIFECNVANCDCSFTCTNTKLQDNYNIAMEPFLTEKKGWGMRTHLLLDKGTFITKYVGEIVTEETYKRRLKTMYKNDIHSYAVYLDKGFVIDSHTKGNNSSIILVNRIACSKNGP